MTLTRITAVEIQTSWFTPHLKIRLHHIDILSRSIAKYFKHSLSIGLIGIIIDIKTVCIFSYRDKIVGHLSKNNENERQ